MLREDITTSTLLQKIFMTKNIARLLSTYDDKADSVPLNEYLNRLCADKNIIPGDVIKKADIGKAYGYHMFTGARQNPSRDIVIKLAFGFEMNYNEAQDLLKTASKSPLHPRVKRDALIIHALNKNFNVLDVQAALEELGLPLLGKECY